MTLVVDASMIVAALVDDAGPGEWARAELESPDLVSPHLMPAEVTNVLRRLVALGRLPSQVAATAGSELALLTVELVPFAPCADRAWALRDNLTTYDAWYVALAELHGAPLATLDHRLVRADGPRCEFRTYRDDRSPVV
ncbi:MAG: type II toxin-antitoxin system VapC family toxin [Nocardioides sp.]